MITVCFDGKRRYKSKIQRFMLNNNAVIIAFIFSRVSGYASRGFIFGDEGNMEGDDCCKKEERGRQDQDLI